MRIIGIQSTNYKNQKPSFNGEVKLLPTAKKIMTPYLEDSIRNFIIPPLRGRASLSKFSCTIKGIERGEDKILHVYVQNDADAAKYAPECCRRPLKFEVTLNPDDEIKNVDGLSEAIPRAVSQFVQQFENGFRGPLEMN